MAGFLFQEEVSPIGTYKNVLSIVLFNNNPWGYHLWYLQAFLYVLAISFFINKHGLWKWGCILTPLMLISAIALGKYSEIVFGREFYNFLSRNFLLTGLPCYAIGHYISTTNICERKCVKNMLPVLLVSCLALAYIESQTMLAGYGDLYLMTIPLSVVIFICTLNCKLRNEGWLSRIGRQDSLYIYILHLLVANALSNFCHVCGIETGSFRYTLPLIVFLITITTIRFLRFIHIIR